MEISIVGGAYLGRSKNINSQLCQNLFPVLDQHGKKVITLQNTPGLVEWADVENAAEVRAMLRVDSYVFAVIGNEVWQFTDLSPAIPDPLPTQITNTLSSSSGRVFIAYSPSYVVIVDPADYKGYYIDRDTLILTQITAAGFPNATSVVYQDSYFVVTAQATGRIYISGITNAEGDPTSWDALDYSTAEGYPDFALVVVSLARELWILGTFSCEIFYNSGDSDFPFERIPGSFFEKGIGARYSVGQADNRIFFIGSDWSVYMSEGLQLKKISTPQIDYHIQEMTQINQATGYAYTHEGATFYVLTFPSNDKTFVYDLTTNMWHTRASGVSETRHLGNCASFTGGKVIVGDYTNGKIYYYDYDVYTDNGDTLIRRRRAKAIDSGRKLVFHHVFEVEFEAGTGLVTGQGSDPQIMLRWSDDGGHQWSNEHWTTLGAIGKYRNRARWKKLGRSRERIYEIAISDPVKVAIISAYLEASLGAT